MNPDLGVTILEKSGKLLSKVKVSGGGRCNVTHACFEIGEMVKRYPRGGNFVRKLFHQFFTTDTIEWFKNRNVLLKQEADGRMFPMTDTSQTIINCLLKETASSGIDIRMNTGVESIEKVGDRFVVLAGNHQRFEADFVCVACGGFPKTSMFEWLLKTGHSIAAPVPSLFTFNLPKHPITQLMGVSVHHAVVKIVGSKQQQQGPVLITHWGLSAPAVLKLSAYAARELADKQWQFEILVNWLPEYNEQSLKEQFFVFAPGKWELFDVP